MSFFDIYLRLWNLFEKRRKSQIFFVFFIINLNALAEFFSVISIMPFLTAIIRPEIFYENQQIKFLINFLNINNREQLISFVTVLFISITLLSTVIKLINSYAQARISSTIGTDLSILSFEKIINKDYENIVNSNSSKFVTITTKFITDTVTGINQFFKICTSMLTIGLILLGLFYINFILSLTIVLVFLFLFLTILFLSKKKLNYWGKIKAEYSQTIVKYVQESNGGIRDIIIDNSQNYFVNNFKKISKKLFFIEGIIEFLYVAPRQIIEAFAISTIAIIALIFSKNNILFLPVLGTIALGSQRLLPAINILYNSIVNIKFNYLPIVSVIKLLEEDNKAENNKIIPFKFKNKITLKGIYFNYLNSNNNILSNINFEINKGERIGIVGKTGSGKSTLIDLILHLLKPTKGKILIDGKDLKINNKKKELISFRYIISHVPQDIFLIDSSFISNIAFGVDESKVDMERVKLVCKAAQISEFIEGSKYSYNTHVGERGMQLSGGQKQRIGIARALYKKSQILILDEATSALDTLTEQKVMKAINSFNPDLTIISIAHRLSTLKDNDRLIYLKDGIIQSDGDPLTVTKLIK